MIERAMDVLKRELKKVTKNSHDPYSLKRALDFLMEFGDKILNRYFPVRNEAGEYMGVLEVTQEVGWIQQLEGQKTLMD